MKSIEDIQPISSLKANTAGVVKLSESRPVIITQNGMAKAVLQDFESYQEQKQALLLLRLIAQGEKEIENKEHITQEELFKRLEKLL